MPRPDVDAIRKDAMADLAAAEKLYKKRAGLLNFFIGKVLEQEPNANIDIVREMLIERLEKMG